MMQLIQVQSVQIVSSAVSQAEIEHVQHKTSDPPLAAAASTTAVQQV